MCGKVLVQMSVKLCWKTACEAAQNYINGLDFFLFFDSNGQTLSANQKMAINRLSQDLSLTECFEMNWFKQQVFFKIYLVYEHIQQQILNPQTWTAGLTLLKNIKLDPAYLSLLSQRCSLKQDTTLKYEKRTPGVVWNGMFTFWKSFEGYHVPGKEM